MQKGKKTPKSDVSLKARRSMDDSSWRDALDAIRINDDDWWCIVTMMVETITKHSRCVSLFDTAAEEGKRKAIYSLSCQKTLATVRKLSKQSLDKCPPAQGVCHYASKLLNEENGTIPSWLMAQIIKYLIYLARKESIGIVKRLTELEREINEEYWIMQTAIDWGQPGTKGFDAESFNKKANTKLRKRGEEWRDAIYVDDAPLSGPNLYIILTGFHDPDLPQDLINAGVPLNFILQIRRANETLDRLVHRSIVEKNSAQGKKLHFEEEYSVDKVKLYDFWTNVEERLKHPETYPEYRDIGFVTFCPPHYSPPPASNDDTYSEQKTDVYNRVSYILYDFYDLYRQHGNYLNSMKVETSIATKCTDSTNVNVYEKILNGFPIECVSVPIVLYAILRQVEANEKELTAEESVDELTVNVEPSTSNTVPLADHDVTLIEEKLNMLNNKFNFTDEECTADDDGENGPIDIELTLNGDTLSESIRLLDKTIAEISDENDNLINDILSIFWFPSITKLYDQFKISEKKLNSYAQHLDNVKRYFDVKINNEEIRHYLNLLMFDKMIFGLTKPKNEKIRDRLIKSEKNCFYLQGLISSMKRSKSLPSLSSKYATEVHVLSDGNIDYGKMIPEILECSSLFDLIDPRELLMPGYLKEHVLKGRSTDKPSLNNYSDVELLSRSVFFQLFHECLLSFDHMELRYFEPNDCLLLYFGNKRRINGVHAEERASNIRTPVRFHDFCKYVVPEEKDWLQKEEELHRLEMAKSMERLMKRSAEIYDATMLFRDEDFILPGTLKARDLEKKRALDKQQSLTDVGVAKSDEVIKDAKKNVQVDALEKDQKKSKKVSDRKTASVHEASPLIAEKVSFVEKEEEGTYDFIGYDLGQLRVQDTNRRNVFYSSDGSLVQVEIDDWLYRYKDIRVTVTLADYDLRLFRRTTCPRINDVFHLTSKNGIVLAFQFTPQPRTEVSLEHDWKKFYVQFRASWPTGLLIEPIVGDGPENPYYIRQSYTPNGCDDTEGNREVCRKFLRDGTVMKYLSNGDVIVLRANGTIVTCTAFEKKETKLSDPEDHPSHVSKAPVAEAAGDLRAKESKILSKGKKRNVASVPQLVGAGEHAPASLQHISTVISDGVSLQSDCTVKVSRYKVLNYNGEQYEVADDLIVSEQHRLLVRMASEYEVDEKFTRRADGTNMLLNSNGELTVRFPDGTRIATGYTIEREPVTCDWTEEDVLRYFTSSGTNGTKGDEEDGEDETYVDTSFLNLGYDRVNSSVRRTEFGEKMDELLITDSFVSVLLTCRAEHKNYATVSYDQSAVSCTLSMHDNLRVSISRRGHYEVSTVAGVNLKIDEDTLSFTGNSCTICGSQSTSTYNFLPHETSTTMYKIVDVFGSTFRVKNDGTIDFYPKSKTSSSLDGRETNNDEETYEGEEEEESREPPCRHESLCSENNNTYRIFSIKRDLTAYEYVHRLKRHQAEMAAAFNDKTSVMLYQSLHRPTLQRLITLEPLGNVSRSKTILSFPDCELKPTNFGRRDLLRSTYSVPYDWVFPFGRNGNGVWENTHDLPLMAFPEILPELLQIRILRGFKEPAANAVIDLQRALGRYWIFIARGITRSYSLGTEKEELFAERSESFFSKAEDTLYNLALGIRRTIDSETYKIGLKRPWRNVKTNRPRRCKKFEEMLLRREEERGHLQWYKRCMKEKFILPYFQNITGTFFLWIMDCISEALDILANRTASCHSSCPSIFLTERQQEGI